MHVLDEAIKKMRAIRAKGNNTTFNQIKTLWRGMRDMTIDFEQFKQLVLA